MDSDTALRPFKAKLDELRAVGDEFLATLDIAAVNLLCASGLPGTETLAIDAYLDKLDEWARLVKLETERSYPKFLDDPPDYENSQGYFCALVLITVLQRDLGVRYNPERARDASFQDPNCRDPDFRDARDLFIHGAIDGPGGTCASMPVLYVAVGRRLGYPLRLVEAPGHLFARWDDPHGKFNCVPDRFNIDGSGHGFSCQPDEHYKTWPRPWFPQEVEAGCYLKSLTPREELAGFLVTRGLCLEDHLRIDEALQCFAWSRDLAPHDIRYHWLLAKTAKASERAHQAMLENIRDMQSQQRAARERAFGLGWPGKPHFAGAIQGIVGALPPWAQHPSGCECSDCTQKQTVLATGAFVGHAPTCQCCHCAAFNSSRATRLQFGTIGYPQPFPAELHRVGFSPRCPT